ncbi:heparan-alpha-glucosaminide N-acetyltransferase domain-containing protein [Gillisia sp. M10.2A]|uniref:Heparan-alpha-glucosaminide N-acetyltransferase domain-containing protein n=1 Tax=Gillisia lutea TaxID=2909668 RepID=A0ABS9ECJ7_9FLAO|nr:heparan-alpha-glucosaminide N-acetyltransferase domain-containing protein [Gillisia lutea]MCF4100601.1 heparan-alpha-glucosaminide N-acetyltransferase domain-containing protein [Gillisia lutea]
MAIKSTRYLSLDVLRGLTIALMVLVNTPGSWGTIYAPFKHAAWHGFTITDLVFPSFLFVVGNAMSFSLKKYQNKSHTAFLQKVLKRSALIFLIGLFLSAFPFVYRNEAGDLVFKNLVNMRIMGVLQRIAVCYLLASLLIHYLKLKGAALVSLWILSGYWLIMYVFGTHPEPYSLTGNAALKFDLLIFRPENLWRGFGVTFDPEGLLSSLPAVVNVVAGYITGMFIQKSGNTFSTVWKLIVAGIVLIIVAYIWNPFFPINKPIWTSSYVLLSVGWDLVIIAALISIIELWNFKRWTYFFEVFGKNPLFIFALSGIVVMLMNIIRIDGIASKTWLYNNIFLNHLTPYNASLAFAVCYMLLMWLVGYVMDKKNIYIKV